MNLLDIANFICGKVNQTEAEDVLACKGFVKQRFELIWQHALWKDSLFEYTQSLSATGYDVDSTWLPTKQVLLLPTQFSHIAAARTAAGKLDVINSGELYRMDFDKFANAGAPVDFRQLPRCVWEFDTAQSVTINGHGMETGSEVTVTFLNSDGTSISRRTADLSDVININDILRIDSISKPETSQEVQFIDRYGNGTQILNMATTDTRVDKRCRIQLFGTVPDPTVIRVLGKTNLPTFIEDDDEPGLTGVENCLLAFGQADMLERERQYGKAMEKFKEAAILLEQLKSVETVQQAHNQRIVPEGGYGDDDYRLSGGLSF